jgi:CubicO group peptidase (beta-lactamase class C family)
MSVLLLVEQGKINLDDDIQEYLPDFPRYESPLTIRHFIHHTSGVRDYLTLWSLAGNNYMDHIDEGAVYRLIKRQETLNFTPGEKYLYSNSCYFMLAMVVEKASGESIQEFARKNIFEPLKMDESHFHDNNLHIIKNRAFSYSPADEGFNNLIMRFDLVGSGGVYSTINDLYKWDQNFYHNILGKGGPELIDKMHEDGILNNGESAGYAFALQNGTYRSLKTVSHGGSLAGYRTYLMRFPEQNFSVILLGNISSFKSGPTARKVADVYLANEFLPVKEAAVNTSSKTPDEEKEYSVANLNQYTGTYYSVELDVEYKLSEQDGSLLLSVKDNDPLKLKSTKIDVFSFQFIELVFDRDDNNSISGLIVNARRVQNLSFVKTK